MYVIEIYEQGIFNLGDYNRPDILIERLEYNTLDEAEEAKKTLKKKYRMKDQYGGIAGNGYELICLY